MAALSRVLQQKGYCTWVQYPTTALWFTINWEKFLKNDYTLNERLLQWMKVKTILFGKAVIIIENALPIPDSRFLRGFKTAAKGFIKGGGGFLLVVWLALFCFPVNNVSAATLTIDGYTIETSGTTCTITGYSGSGGAITIPGTLSDGTNSYTVMSIGANAFSNNTNLTSVTIPNSVTSIGDWAFASNSALVAAYFRGNMPTFGSPPFDGAATGFTVYIPKGNTTYAAWTVYTKQEYSYGLIFKGAQWKIDGTIRIIATIDSLEPSEVGFVYSTNADLTNSATLSTATVYASIIAHSETKTAASLGGTYIVAIPVSGITDSIYVRTFATKDGTTEYGAVFTVTPASLP